MSNFKVTNAPELQPAVDFLTQSANGPFVDTGGDYRDRTGRIMGRVYLSIDTIRHLADVAGVLATSSDAELTRAYNKGLVDGVKEDLGGNLVRVADTLQRFLDDVPGRVGASG